MPDDDSISLRPGTILIVGLYVLITELLFAVRAKVRMREIGWMQKKLAQEQALAASAQKQEDILLANRQILFYKEQVETLLARFSAMKNDFCQNRKNTLQQRKLI